MLDTVFFSFERENWMWLLRHNPNILCELNFIGQDFQRITHEQEIVQIFTHMKLTNLTLFTSKLY